jgi:hypothetical protein
MPILPLQGLEKSISYPHNMKDDPQRSSSASSHFAHERDEVKRGKTDLPQAIYKCARAKAMCPTTFSSVSFRTLSICYLFICVFLVRTAMGGSNVPCDLTFPHGSVLRTNWILTVLPMVAGCPCQARYFS